jgi:hypothetical protein
VVGLSHVVVREPTSQGGGVLEPTHKHLLSLLVDLVLTLQVPGAQGIDVDCLPDLPQIPLPLRLPHDPSTTLPQVFFFSHTW